jgi:hypothetical protein
MGVGAETRPETSPASGLFPALIVAALTTVVISVPYWASSYASIRDDGIFGSFVLVAGILFLGTVVACAAAGRHSWVAMGTMFACVPIAVIGRVVIDTAADPTTHDLWPLEVVGAVFLGILPICAGALVAWPIRRLISVPGANEH